MATRVRTPSSALYEQDFYAWAREQAALLRAGRHDELDLEHLSEEIEDLGGSLYRSVRSRIRTIVEHLLKLEHSPAAEPRALWRDTIHAQRADLEDDLTPSLRRQMRQASVVMGALARARGANEEAWRILGLLHNLDFDRVKEPERHCLVAAKVLGESGLHPAGIHAIAAHNDKGLSETGIRCLSALDHAVSCAEAVVGLVHAASQVLPSKDPADLKLKSLRKRYGDPRFAANVERDLIARCEGLGLDLDAFLELSLAALQQEPIAP